MTRMTTPSTAQHPSTSQTWRPWQLIPLLSRLRKGRAFTPKRCAQILLPPAEEGSFSPSKRKHRAGIGMDGGFGVWSSPIRGVFFISTCWCILHMPALWLCMGHTPSRQSCQVCCRLTAEHVRPQQFRPYHKLGICACAVACYSSCNQQGPAADVGAHADVQADAAIAGGVPYKKFHRKRKANWYGCFCFAAYIVALCVYMYIRASKTLGLGGYLG